MLVTAIGGLQLQGSPPEPAESPDRGGAADDHPGIVDRATDPGPRRSTPSPLATEAPGEPAPQALPARPNPTSVPEPSHQPALASPTGCWANTYGTGQRDGVLFGHFAGDDYVLAGAIGADEGDPKGASLGWAMLLDDVGVPRFSKAYGRSGSTDWFSSIRPVPDGGFVAMGSRGAAAWIVRLDEDGELLWERLYDGLPSHARVRSANPTSDGGLVLGGLGFGRQHDGFVLRTDADGDVLWSLVIRQDHRQTDPAVYDEVWDVREVSDGGFVGVGWSVQPRTQNQDAVVFRLDDGGGVEWVNTYGTRFGDRAHWVAETHDGGFVTAGSTKEELENGGARYAWLLEVSPSGTLRWQRVYALGADQEAFHVHPVEGGRAGYLLGGSTKSGDRDGWIWKVDDRGVPEWSRTYGGEGDDTLRFVHPNAGHGHHGGHDELLAAGYTGSFGDGNADKDGFVLRLPADGRIEPLGGTGFTTTDTTSELEHWEAPLVTTMGGALGVGVSGATAVTPPPGEASEARDVAPATRALGHC